jgi:glutathione S-transferase
VYRLYIANKNYSSWSLRPWVLMSELGIEFTEQLVPFGDAASWTSYCKISPAGKVPCLANDGSIVWDSLAITEYLAERHAGVWPTDSHARAWARSAAAEMHSGFSELRHRCAMSCGVRIRLHESTPGFERDLARLSELWSDGLHRFGGPFLAGESFSAADAFFAPVAFRVQTYALAVEGTAARYVALLLNLRSMRRWYAEALEETFRDEPHEREIAQMGVVLQDLRQK